MCISTSVHQLRVYVCQQTNSALDCQKAALQYALTSVTRLLEMSGGPGSTFAPHDVICQPNSSQLLTHAAPLAARHPT